VGVLLLVLANPAPAPFQELNEPRLSESHAVRSDAAEHHCWLCCYVCKGGHDAGVVGIGAVDVAAAPAQRDTFAAFM
jgi:hypothetical protein